MCRRGGGGGGGGEGAAAARMRGKNDLASAKAHSGWGALVLGLVLVSGISVSRVLERLV